ncbi:MAG: redox-sensing transcriptional repressor Rex [Armatimonadetes bacterium]|jgi:redox-sensing transcriptional repressor|nr:redox-sensing transcriptional repressor Rex [Armatimonadota bacterium]
MPWQFDIPEATVQRLSTYRAILRRLEREGRPTVSSWEIAAIANVNAAQVRKDLSYFGDFGRRGLGYRVPQLHEELTRILGLMGDRRVIVVGAGNLGSALVGYPGFEPRGFRVVGVFDASPDKVGQMLNDQPILPMSRLPELVPELGVDIAIVAVPGAAAQEVVDAVVTAGVRCVLNLAPVQVSLPPGIVMRSFDMTSQLEILSFCLSHIASDSEPERTP